jgi:hypothetical protein
MVLIADRPKAGQVITRSALAGADSMESARGGSMRILILLLFFIGIGVPQGLGGDDDEKSSASNTSAPKAKSRDASEAEIGNSPLPDNSALMPFTLDPGVPEKKIYWKGWGQFAPNVLKDQKKIWSFPLSISKGDNLKPTLAIISITTGLLALDPHSGKYFHKNDSYDGFNRVLSGPNTALAMELFPAAFYGFSLIRRDSYGQKTFLLAGEAVLSSEILTIMMKDITRRLNPGVVPTNGSYSDTWFKKENGSWIRGIGSFPSGHTIAAFSIATVFAKRYPKPRWIPWMAYGLASLVGFSRISLETHFPSDVFLGAALGYAISQNAVRRGP